MDRFPTRKVGNEIIQREEIDKELYLEPITYLRIDDPHDQQSFPEDQLLLLVIN